MMAILRVRRQAAMLTRRAQIRLTFIAGGLAVGVAAVTFAKFADEMTARFQEIMTHQHLAALVMAPAGFALANYLARRVFPNSQGSGIPQVIAARALTDEAARHRLVSLRLAIGKMLLTGLGLLCGASIGREGPTVQVGASVMYAVGHISKRHQRGLVLAGAAAGVAAAFNAPLAGIVFAIEEMSQAYEAKTSGLVIATVICGGLVSLAWLGDYAYFGMSGLNLHGASVWLAVPLCGAVGGLLGGLFSRLLVEAGDTERLNFGRFKPGNWIKRHPAAYAAVCGLAVALCGLVSADQIYGTGYTSVLHLLSGQNPPPASFGILKFLATLISAISGIPGGIFSPSLAVGAGIGRNLFDLVAIAPMQAMVVLGMVGYFAGVVQAPITAFVIVTEMTGDHALLVPVMLTAMIGHSASRLVCKEGVYHALSRRFMPQSTPH